MHFAILLSTALLAIAKIEQLLANDLSWDVPFLAKLQELKNEPILEQKMPNSDESAKFGDKVKELRDLAADHASKSPIETMLFCLQRLITPLNRMHTYCNELSTGYIRKFHEQFVTFAFFHLFGHTYCTFIFLFHFHFSPFTTFAFFRF